MASGRRRTSSQQTARVNPIAGSRAKGKAITDTSHVKESVDISTHFYEHNDEDQDKDCHWCQLRSMPNQARAPITVVTDKQDNAELPTDFTFITHMVLGKGVKPAEDSFRSGCSCHNARDCQYSGCHCLAELDEEEEEMQVDGVASKRNPYYTHGEKAGHLRSHMIESKTPLYECHSGCSCPPSCPNRVVERGRTIPLEIFHTGDRGWGVRSRRHVKRGQFVDQYMGEIITSEEANRRRNASKRKDVYLFALDKFTDPESLDTRLQGPPLEVDGEFMSGPTRFINHSCEPNLRIFARVGDHADKHMHELALFAIRDINAGEELTFDYVDGSVDEDEELPRDQASLIPCLCGSKNCRQYLW